MKKILLALGLLLLTGSAFAQVQPVICASPSTACPTGAGSGTGDAPYVAFGKINSNFAAIPSQLFAGLALPIANGGTGATTLAGANLPVQSGAITTGHCVQWASSTSITDSGSGCGSGGTIANQTVLGNGSGSTAAATALTLAGNLIATSTTLGTTQLTNAQVGTSYAIVTGDGGKLVTFNNAASIAVTIAQAGSAGFLSGYSVDVENLGAGVVTITPTTSTINGAATLVLTQNEGCTLVSDGANYQVEACNAVFLSNLTQASNTSLDGLVLADTTAATAANQQYSPRIRLTGQGWKTTATAASQPVDWIIENRPVQGSTNPSTQLAIATQINGGGYTDKITVNSGNISNLIGSWNITGTLNPTGAFTSGGTTFTVASGTGACATTGTLVGGGFAGSFVCTGTTGASTATITVPAVTHAWSCAGRDVTTPTTLTQTGAVSTTSITLTMTSVTANDVIQFHCIGY